MLVLRLLLAILVLPVMVVIVIPGALMCLTGSTSVGWGLGFPWHLLPMLAGVLLCGVGLSFAVWTATLFIKFGRGTPAPWDPPQNLVILGPYRHVRNPMITSVFFMLTGLAILFGTWPVATWLAIFITANLLYIPRVEEPGLVKRFGEDYVRYKGNVPRWLPSWRGWGT